MSRLHLPRRIRRFLKNLEMVLNGWVHPQEDSVKVASRSKIRNLVKTYPPSLFLESRRTWTFLMNQEKVRFLYLHFCNAARKLQLFETKMQVFKESKVKSCWRPSVQCQEITLYPSHSWWTWRWCQIWDNIHLSPLWKFHQDLTSGTMSRLHLSCKSLPGVLEDILDDMVYGVIWVKVSFRSFCESFIKIWH